MSAAKARRQREIARLVASRRVRTHQSLAGALAGLGITASQGTISRDLRELRVVKTADGYTLPTAAARDDQASAQLVRALSQFLVEIRLAQNIVILRTNPGEASALARCLDAVRWPEIAGTIAGDDTVFAAAADSSTARRVRERLERL